MPWTIRKFLISQDTKEAFLDRAGCSRLANLPSRAVSLPRPSVSLLFLPQTRWSSTRGLKTAPPSHVTTRLARGLVARREFRKRQSTPAWTYAPLHYARFSGPLSSSVGFSTTLCLIKMI